MKIGYMTYGYLHLNILGDIMYAKIKIPHLFIVKHNYKNNELIIYEVIDFLS